MKKHRRYIFLLALFCGLFIAAPAFAQTTPTTTPVDSDRITGIWIGVLQQIEGGTRAAYPFVMVLTQAETGSDVEGTSFIALPDNPSQYAAIALTGSIAGGRFDFAESEVVSQNADELRWCIKRGTLLLNREELSGAWQGDQTCVPGLISLTRVSEQTSLETIVENELVSGIWVGSLYQDDGGGYPFVMVLSQAGSGDSVQGTSFIALPDDPSTYAAIALDGSISENQFTFTETEIIAEADSKPFSWCLKNGALTRDGQVLSGTWQGDNTCESGSVVLVRLV